MPIVGTVDGDTIRTYFVDMPCPLCRGSVRIRGIDTPEKGSRAKCAVESELAARASALTKKLIGTQDTMVVSNYHWDKYGGRIVADVHIGGVNIGQSLIEAGLAVPYDGGKKTSWCR